VQRSNTVLFAWSGHLKETQKCGSDIFAERTMRALRGKEGRCQMWKTNVHRGALALGMVLCLSAVAGAQAEREYSCKDQPGRRWLLVNSHAPVIQSLKVGQGTSLITAFTS
jgi:hypothetical protein